MSALSEPAGAGTVMSRETSNAATPCQRFQEACRRMAQEANYRPAAPGDAAAKGDTFEVASEIIAPGVIDAGQVLGMAAPLQADEIAAMGAAIDHCLDLAVLAARNDDRGLA